MKRTFSENDSQIRVGAKERFALELPAMPGAGYKWEVEFDSSNLSLVGETQKPAGNVGGNNVQCFEFEALSAGKAVVNATYKRRWESQALEKKVFNVTITAKA